MVRHAIGLGGCLLLVCAILPACLGRCSQKQTGEDGEEDGEEDEEAGHQPDAGVNQVEVGDRISHGHLPASFGLSQPSLASPHQLLWPMMVQSSFQNTTKAKSRQKIID